MKVRAVDNDEGKNGEIKYEILSGNEERSFTLSSITGELKVAKKLDFEQTQSYKVGLIFKDLIFYNLPIFFVSSLCFFHSQPSHF